ncbi:Alpha/Beta hydrolase protein [Aspergillus pseudoustus]|uniref:Alpha/Beta hydrolase protein n=1 Tax=Aspergillus pseudoustus TaxID=1810923 RepID=A0ABR4JI04_9EURO
MNAADRSGKEALTSTRAKEKVAGYWLNRGLSPNPIEPKDSDIVIYYIHGGGYTIVHPADNPVGLLYYAEALASKDTTCSIFFSGLFLAPGSCLPTQITEAIAAYQYLVEQERIAHSKVVVMGESAGGHLALSFLTALQVPTHRPDLVNAPPKTQYAILLSPWIDLLNSHPSVAAMRKRDFLSKTSLERSSSYLLKDTNAEQKHVITNFGKRDNTRGSWKHILPDRIWITAGGDEMFLEDIKEFASEDGKDGAEVCFEVTRGKAHPWQTGEAYGHRKRLLSTPISAHPHGIMGGYTAVASNLVNFLKKD